MHFNTDEEAALLPKKASPEKLLTEIAENSRIQAENSRKQLFYTRFCAAALAAIFVIVLVSTILVVPNAVRVLDDISEISSRLGDIDIEALMESADKLLKTLEIAANELEPLIDNINDTLLEAQIEMADALRAIQSIDIETLNQAISDLAAVVEPFARLFGK